MPLLEVTAGQGTSLGHRFEQLAEVFDRVRDPERLGVCFDTCHLYAAGYDIATETGYAKTMRAFDRIVGRKRLKAVHLNDSKKGLGSKVDRHARAGEGVLGLETFRRIVNDRALQGHPAGGGDARPAGGLEEGDRAPAPPRPAEGEEEER